MNARELSQVLEVSEATVSRLGSGHRKPSTELMMQIADKLKWPIGHQAQAMRDGQYPDTFRQVMECGSYAALRRRLKAEKETPPDGSDS